MEEELNYASITFKNTNVSIPKEVHMEETIYAEVKTEGCVSDHSSASTEEEKSSLQRAHRMALCLGTICVLLLAAIIILCVHFGAVIAEHNTILSDYANETSNNRLLKSEKVELERQNLKLSKDRDGLNWTLEFILQFQHFPVEDYCPQKPGNTKERECRTCLDGWRLFQSSCYQFTYAWESWDGSRKNCQSKNADLVVIGSQHEQEFISNHIESYYDEFHGYWMGLRFSSKQGRWLWVDGSNLTAGYWATEDAGSGRCVLALPQSPRRPSITALANWDRPMWSTMRNRWICETKAFIRPE